MSLDILFLAHNRLEFTQRSFRFLADHTPWDRVERLVVYDDGSEPRARLWLQDACAEFDHCPVLFCVRETRWASPVAIMLDYLTERAPADWFVKIDNDVAVPEGWLDALLGVTKTRPWIDLLGMEAGMTRVQGRDGAPHDAYEFQRSSHIGGVGLMKTSIFFRRGHRLVANGRYYGFTEWQHHQRSLNRGWIAPDLAVPLLDRIPVEPFLSLSERYREAGWQRDWGTYPADWLEWAYGWVLEKEAVAA